jgi:YgiT-type zinc finger domain-containing protein
MNCPLCKGMMVQGKTSMLIQQEESSSIVINNIPALICEQCGDDFIADDIARKIEKLADKLKAEGVKMGFVDYTRAA